jgi:hypothetical protein
MLKIRIKKDLRSYLQRRDDVLGGGLLRVSTEMKNALALATPVDTGLARDSWKVGQVGPTRCEISNGVPYIESLNNGHSTQAPVHFIEQVALDHGRAEGAIVRITSDVRK